MSTSAIITNRIVRSRSLPERPKRGTRSVSFSLDGAVMRARYNLAESTEKVYQTAQPWIVQGRRKIADCRAFADFRQSRIRDHNSGHRADVEAARERERPCGDQFAGLRPDDTCAQNAAVFGGNDLDVALGRALSLGAVVFVVRPAQHADFLVALAGLRFGQADMRKLRIGEGDVRDQSVVHAGAQAKQRIPDHDPGVLVRRVGEMAAGDVADRVSALVRRLQSPVDRNPGTVVFDARLLEFKTGDVGTAACRDQKI